MRVEKPLGSRTDLYGGLAVGEFLEIGLGDLLAQAVADGLDELGVGRAGEDAHLVLFGQPDGMKREGWLGEGSNT